MYLDISRKFHLGSFRKHRLWFEGIAIFLLPEVCSTEFNILSIRAFSDHVIRHILYYVYGQDFQPGVGGGGRGGRGGVLPMMAFSGRLRPKGVSFSGLGYMKECGIHY